MKFLLSFSLVLASSHAILASPQSIHPSQPKSLFRHAHSRPWELTLKQSLSSGECTLFSLRQVQQYRDLVSLPSKDQYHVLRHEDKLSLGFEIVNVVGFDRDGVKDKAVEICGGEVSRSIGEEPEVYEGAGDQVTLGLPVKIYDEVPKLEIEPLLESGPSNNRVDLVFFSDGYLREEKQKFIDDAMRLAKDISNNQTFYTVRPLMNFWAAFTPSRESGIGVGGRPKDTPFGLYRDGTELRGVYYSKPDVARAACQSLGDQCDYPILMGNDPLYGGLGGEFTVITPSLANGALVLRHELGHSVIDVGEEYDGGFAYFGVNALHDVSKPISWAHWLSKPPSRKHLEGQTSEFCESTTETPHAKKRRVEKTVMPFQAYTWEMLRFAQPISLKFNSSGMYPRYILRFSLSGVPQKNDLEIRVDGKIVNYRWEFREDIGMDRWHYDLRFFDGKGKGTEGGLEEGEHEVEFELISPWWDGIAQLCSVEVMEFGTEEEFITAPGYYGLFPTFSLNNETSYRPTNEDCLMRIVTTPNFCSVCLEGLWLSLLRRVDLMDDVEMGCKWSNTWPTRRLRTLDLKLLPLAEFREDLATRSNKLPKESYSIRWYKDGTELDEYKDLTHVEMDDSGEEGAMGVYSIEVKFSTEEVRVDGQGLLRSKGDFFVEERCRNDL